MFSLFTRAFRQQPPPPAQPAELTKKAQAESYVYTLPQDRLTMRLPRKLEPDHVEQILESALAGDLTQQAALFAMMEDTWPRLLKNVNEVKRAVARLPYKLDPYVDDGAEPTPEAEDKAALVRRVLKNLEPDPTTSESGFHGAIYDLLDAFAKGISVLEIEWGKDGRPWSLKGGTWGIRAFRQVPARFYGYPQTGNVRDRLMLSRDGLGHNGALEDFPVDKFLIGRCPSRSGHPANVALLRSLAKYWVGAQYGYQWLANFAQMFGIPIRWANYEPNNESQRAAIGEMLENLGSAGWGAFPKGTELQLHEAKSTGRDNPQAYLMEVADKACDILILGQTLTTDVGDSGSRALGDVHASIRGDVIDSAAEWVEGVINDQLIPALMRHNYGETPDDCPTLSFERPRAKDAKAMAERDKILFGELGLPVAKRFLYDRHEVPEPQAGDDLFSAPTPTPGRTEGPAAPQDERSAPQEPAQARRTDQPSTIHSKARQGAIFARMADNIMTDLAGVSAEWLGPARPIFLELIRTAQDRDVSDAEFAAAVESAAAAMPELFGDLNTDALAEALEKEMGAAMLNGAIAGAQRRS